MIVILVDLNAVHKHQYVIMLGCQNTEQNRNNGRLKNVTNFTFMGITATDT